jgi:hypothetical protein
MALTVTLVKRDKTVKEFLVIADVKFDNSYVTGGEDLTPAMLGLHNVNFLNADGVAGQNFEYLYQTQKFKCFAAAGSEAASAADLSAVTTRIVALGI